MTSRVLPALRHFRPELILISAGFDAHRDDPLAALEFVEDKEARRFFDPARKVGAKVAPEEQQASAATTATQ